VDGSQNRLEHLPVIPAEALGLSRLDPLHGIEEKRSAVSESVQASITVSQLIGRLLMAFEFQLGHHGLEVLPV
jgi:hypothetical protein